MKLVLLFTLLTTGACGPKSNPSPSPSGATVIDWRLAQSDRDAIRQAATSDVKVFDREYTAHPTNDTAVKLMVHLESATVVFREADEQVSHHAPIALTVKVLDGGDFTFGKVTCMGPHYKLSDPETGPLDMLLHCYTHATKPSYDVGFTMYAYADGTINDGNPTTVQILEQ
jgi:hypothetical protein